jgi:hypothetical protein
MEMIITTYDGLRRGNPRCSLTAQNLWIDSANEQLLLNNLVAAVPACGDVRNWYNKYLPGNWDRFCGEGDPHNFDSHWTAMTEGARGSDLLLFEDDDEYCNPHAIGVSPTHRSPPTHHALTRTMAKFWTVECIKAKLNKFVFRTYTILVFVSLSRPCHAYTCTDHATWQLICIISDPTDAKTIKLARAGAATDKKTEEINDTMMEGIEGVLAAVMDKRYQGRPWRKVRELRSGSTCGRQQHNLQYLDPCQGTCLRRQPVEATLCPYDLL